MSDKTVKEHFTPEALELLERAYQVITEVSFEGAHEWRDVRVIERAEVAANDLSRLISAARIYYDLPPAIEPQSLRVAPEVA